MELHKDPAAVIAIDFGTARSGYAFSFIEPLEIKDNHFDFEDNKDKICTCLLLIPAHNKQLKFCAFGNEADAKLSYLEREGTENIVGFKHFKMNLFREENVVVATNGARVPVVDVIAYSIQFLAASALEQLNQCTNKHGKAHRFTMDDVQWVITVPALWNDAAKQIMRNAAIMVGLPPTLILALEPEAAALCCRKYRKDLEFNPGTKYMIVDCGGGTIDIAVHEIDEKGFTHSACIPKGGYWGSTAIDNHFQQLLFEIFDPAELELPSIMAEFERKKIAYSPHRIVAETVVIQILDAKPHNLQKVNERFPDSPIKFTDSRLFIPKAVMCSFFEEPINSIVACIKSTIEEVNGVDYIFMVGGFSRNVILKDTMIREFQTDNTQVILPDNPGMAVAQGAVYFGLNPKIISSRFSNLTYGISVVRKFIEGVHPPERKIQREDEFYCEGAFSRFVTINQKVRPNHEVSTFVGRVARSTDTVVVPLYCSKRADVEYISEETQKLADLILKVPTNEELGTHNVKVTMIFGGTEIRVKAEHVITKLAVSCSISFTFKSLSEVYGLPAPLK